MADDLPLFTLGKSLVVSGFWTSAIPQGYSNTIEILASGKIPGLLQPGESVTVPVYYAGMQEPWNRSESQFKFDLRVFTTSDTDNVDWTSLQPTLQPTGVSSTAWAAIYQNLASAAGTASVPPVYMAYYEDALSPDQIVETTSDQGSARGAVTSSFLTKKRRTLCQLGEDVIDINQLWGFAVQQADAGLSPIGPDLASADG